MSDLVRALVTRINRIFSRFHLLLNRTDTETDVSLFFFFFTELKFTKDCTNLHKSQSHSIIIMIYVPSLMWNILYHIYELLF